MAKSLLVALALSLLLVASADAADPVLERGQAELAPFKQQLMGALKAGLAEGPDQAIDACRVEAPKIAAGLTTDQVKLGRTSHRPRNPENAGPAWAAAVLQDYMGEEGDWQPRAVELPGQRTGYVEPIVTQPLCLACHGSELAPSVAEALRAQYPEDRATGFAVGDLRGVFWVSFDDTTGDD